GGGNQGARGRLGDCERERGRDRYAQYPAREPACDAARGGVSQRRSVRDPGGWGAYPRPSDTDQNDRQRRPDGSRDRGSVDIGEGRARRRNVVPAPVAPALWVRPAQGLFNAGSSGGAAAARRLPRASPWLRSGARRARPRVMAAAEPRKNRLTGATSY